MFYRSSVCLALALLLTGCGGIQLDPNVPADFDLNGVWVLDAAASDPVPKFDRRGASRDDLVGRRPSQGERQRLRGAGLSFVGPDFQILRAKQMTIEQDARSMGIAYRPGTYRDVSWGDRTRGLWEVHAGWGEGMLVIYSKADDAQAFERFMLIDEDRLLVQVQIKAASDDVEINLEFVRQ